MSVEQPEVSRLEQLWRSDFGNAYVDRNIDAGGNRGPFWRNILERFPARRVLEVGCNVGANLRWIAESVAPQEIFGVDINLKALDILHQRYPTINGIYSPARELPFRDGWFDFVFTMGVLIHQPDSTLPLVMAEIVRCSSRFIFCGEYFSETRTEVFYREQDRALIKRDFGRIYQELFPQLRLHDNGFLSRVEGWDDVTYWVFEKSV